jgi:ABC-type Fe3+ transport system substrate-binding protein
MTSTSARPRRQTDGSARHGGAALVRGVAVAGVLCLALAGCGGAAAPGPSGQAGLGAPAGSAGGGAAAQAGGGASLQQLIDGARKEGALNFAWSADTAGTPEDFQQWADAFNNMYGLNLKVQFTPFASMAEMASKLTQEAAAQRPATTDLYLGSPFNALALYDAHDLQTVDWASWATNVKDPRLVAAGGAAVEFELVFPGISYNTSLIKGAAIPKTLQDLLKPEYKGKAASTPYAAHFNELATPELWGEQKTTNYVKALAGQAAGLIGCGELQRVATGEFPLLAIDCDSNVPREMASKGAPIGHVIPSDAPLYYPEYLAVPVNSVHPNGAKLWVNFVLSRQGQDLLYKETFGDHPLLPGSRTASELADLKASAPNAVETDIAFFQKQDARKMNQLSQQYTKILQGK